MRCAVPATRARAQRGSATAELAVALPSLGVLLAIAVTLLALLDAKLRCVDAARDVARALARGDTTATAVAEGRATAPAAAVISVTENGEEATVTVTVAERPLYRLTGPILVSATAVMPLECPREAGSGDRCAG